MKPLRIMTRKTRDNPKKRFFIILGKWLCIGFLIYYLWYFKFFTILFVYIPLELQYQAGLVFTYGLSAYLRVTYLWWILAGLSIVLLIFVEYYSHYAHKRRSLMIGGGFEGRTVWIKGLRQGLIYDVWDFKNYLSYSLGKKKGMGPKMPVSRNDTGNSNGIKWPNPWAIGWGPQILDYYIIYYYKSFWQIKPDFLLYPANERIGVGFFRYVLKQGNLKRIRAPRGMPFLAEWVYVWNPLGNIIRYPVKPGDQTKENRRMLGRSRHLTRDAIESDPETAKNDYGKQSFRSALLTEDPGDFDD